MAKEPMGLGDIITANTSKKTDLAIGAASWYGWFMIGRGLKKIFGSKITNAKLGKDFYKKPLNYKVNDW